MYGVGFRFIMPLIEEIVTDSYGSMDVNGEAPVTASGNYEKLEIQSEGISLCFVEKRTEMEDEVFMSDTLERAPSTDDTHIFGKRSSFQHQPYMSMIQEIDSQDDADLCKELLAHGNTTETDLHMLCSVNVDSSEKKEEEDPGNGIICKFYCESYFFYRTVLGKTSHVAQSL